MRRLTVILLAVVALTACSGDSTEPPPGNPAPDFELELGEGGTFVLSEEPRPVYLVFWAEW